MTGEKGSHLSFGVVLSDVEVEALLRHYDLLPEGLSGSALEEFLHGEGPHKLCKTLFRPDEVVTSSIPDGPVPKGDSPALRELLRARRRAVNSPNVCALAHPNIVSLQWELLERVVHFLRPTAKDILKESMAQKVPRFGVVHLPQWVGKEDHPNGGKLKSAHAIGVHAYFEFFSGLWTSRPSIQDVFDGLWTSTPSVFEPSKWDPLNNATISSMDQKIVNRVIEVKVAPALPDRQDIASTIGEDGPPPSAMPSRHVMLNSSMVDLLQPKFMVIPYERS